MQQGLARVAHCYAETFSERWRGVEGHPYELGFDLRIWPGRLELPLHWKRPRRIFVNSMSDLFHEDIPEEYIRRVFDVMVRADWHIFQVLSRCPSSLTGRSSTSGLRSTTTSDCGTADRGVAVPRPLDTPTTYFDP